ncbi:MAG: M15 family metallopeptidase [Pseudomonadota bacterium]
MDRLPEGFSYLETHDASILQEIRYAGYHNFVGCPIDGYEANRCVVSNALGQALANVQAELKTQQLSLKVYEAYRPLRAGAHFMRWSLDPGDQTMKTEFYPDIEKNTLFAQGYVALRSQHTRGCAVDLTLVSCSCAATRSIPTRPFCN